jgi:GNAT superfamily N-acetyltransferase
MIERLTPESLPKSLPFYRAFLEDLDRGYPGLYEPNPEHFLTSWGTVLTMGIGAALLAVCDNDPLDHLGVLFATVTPDLIDGRLVATEHGWYVMPHARGSRVGSELIEAYEAWAFERGAEKVMMAHVVRGMPDLGAYFAKRGYAPLEMHYLRAV